MPAIAPHSTATTDSAWDGPGAEAKLKNDGDASYYKKEFAWYDASGDDTKKSTYKFPHHMVSGDGEVGAANTVACSAIIASLNGGRGGAKIPEADRAGVHAHAAKHLKDAGKDVPELKSESDYLMALAESRVGEQMERRYVVTRIEIREAYRQDPVMEGHAAVFNTWYDLGYFKESVAPGAFAKACQEDDVRALWNHDPNHVLARTNPTMRKAGNATMTLQEDTTGLLVRINPPDTHTANDLIKSMKRGDVDQMSIGFSVRSHQIDRDADGNIMRTIKDVKLYDVSPVTFPASPTTDIAVRSVADAIEAEFRRLKAEREAVFVADDLWKRNLDMRQRELDMMKLLVC